MSPVWDSFVQIDNSSSSSWLDNHLFENDQTLNENFEHQSPKRLEPILMSACMYVQVRSYEI